MKSYKDFYTKTIEANPSLKGLKLVLGGTGLGKTYGLLETIDEYVNHQPDRDFKFIYLTNRHNLITQQEKKLREKYDISTTYLKSNREVILNLHQSIGLQEVINELESLNFFQYDDELKNKFARQSKFKKLIKSIESKYKIVENEQQPDFNVKETIEKDLNFDCSEFFKLLKRQSVLIYREDKPKYESIQQEKIIWKLFPYVEFENNPECNVLLVTIHKVLRGFFNGKADIKLASIEDKIIFLDEFDFLESDILKILCDEPSIINPLEFVRIFYQEFKHWSQVDFWNSSDELRTVQEKFEEVIQYIDESCEKFNINLIGVRDFRLADSESTPKSNVLFQANQIITPKPFFLKEENNSWIVESKQPKDSINPRILFNILTISTSKIVGVFNYFKHNPNLVNEIIQKIWNQKNDNQGGVYEKYIKENMLYHRTKPKDKHDSTLYKDKSAYEIGYRLIKLLKRTNTFDPNSAELNQVELFTTPESLIAKLSDSNLVFALSATTDLPRTLRCFNLEWLKNNTPFIPLDKEDYSMIEKLRNEKAEIRGTTIKLQIAETLDEDSEFQKALLELWKVNYFGDNGSHRFLLDRVSKTLNKIDSILHSEKFAHLVFLTTFKEIKNILNRDSTVDDALNEFENSDFETTQIIDNTNKYFHLKWKRKSCNLIFLSAEDAKKLEEPGTAIEKYQKAFQADKVIVITQYNSASNGVNLPCYDEWRNETDFRGLHLLEENHFWFDDEEKDFSKFKNIEKQAFWYLWKLWDDRQIDKFNFKTLLNKRAPNNNYKPHIKTFNKLYKDTPEKILNAVSLYHQAIGRIEREWKSIPEVDITLDEGVFLEFYRYLTTEDFQELIKHRDEKITSALILEIQKSVSELATKKNIKEAFSKPKSIKSDNDRSIDLIQRFLAVIENLKKNEYDHDNSTQIKEDWQEIREVVLKHDFKARFDLESLSETLDVERDLCFETNRLAQGKEILLDSKKLEIHKELPLREVYRWNLDFVYERVNQNNVIKSYFENNGYKTVFETNTIGYKTFFTPYIYQAILQGAIGEKAIEALLDYNGFELENPIELPNELFEVIDAKVKGSPIYLDFKNFSNTTLNKFHLTEDDPVYEYQFDSEKFIEKQVEKYQIIRAIDPKAILYIINLFSDDNREPDYFDNKGKRQNKSEKSCIRIIPNVLVPGNENSTNTYFQFLVQEIESKYETI